MKFDFFKKFSVGGSHSRPAASQSVGDTGAKAELKTPAAIGKILKEASALKKAGHRKEAVDMLEEAFVNIKPDPVVAYRLVSSLLEMGEYARIDKLKAARPFNSRDFSIAEFLCNNDARRRDELPLQSQAPAPHIGYVTMVKDEEDIILFNLVWHYHLGLRRFFIIDNLSSDRTAELIQTFAARFPDATVLTLRDPVVAYYQSRKMTAGCHFMRALWPELEWLALVDADEFLCPTAPLASVLARVEDDVDAVIMAKSFYRLTNQAQAAESDYFFRRIMQRQPLAHGSAKILVRARELDPIGQGNHRIAEQERYYSVKKYVACPELTMREYPVRSFRQFARKTKNGGQAIAAAVQEGFAKVGGTHWAEQHSVLQSAGMDGLRKKFGTMLQHFSTKATIKDPMPVEAVMDQLLPDWRSLVPRPVGHQEVAA